ncbi:MAG: response regulator [Treponemataceae bacterium]|nr:response regulator [Treponemataceae bacterium]
MEAKKKILIVDDEQINLEFFDVMLSKLGFVVEKAENGMEALEKVRSFGPDLILLDNIMPKLSGWEVTKLLKKDPEYHAYKDIPIIMFSAMDDVKDKVEGFELGVDDYITKPYNFSEVLARIRAVLRHRELFSQIAVRESRLSLTETINEEMKKFLKNCEESVNLLEQAVEQSHGGANGLELLQQTVKNVTSNFRTKLLELDAKMHAIEKQHELLRKKEIEINTLEHQFRKSLHAD